MARAKQRNRKSRITTLTPEEMKARREAQELNELERQSKQRIDGRKPENWGINSEALSLPANATVEVATDRKGKARGAWRSNPFKLLAEGTSPVLTAEESDAGFRLLGIYAASKGLDGAPERSLVVIDGNNPDAWGREDRKQANITRIANIWAWQGVPAKNVDALSSVSRSILQAFCVALVEEDRPCSWGGIVQRVCPSATTRQRQSERFKTACEQLAGYFREEVRPSRMVA